jgi:hypothetical protein
MKNIFYRIELWIASTGVIIAAVLWQYRLRFPFDDAFISFRYAEHLASGYGLVWNTGGPHTEGFTNFFFVVILATVRFFTSDLLMFAQVIGLASTILTGILIYRIAEILRNRAVGILALSFYWAVPLTWVNALSGMETSLFVMLCTFVIFLVLRERFFIAFGVAFLAVLTRPEAALLAAILSVCNILYSRDKRRAITSFLFAFVLPCAIYSVWKYFYFGALLPNAFYIKVLGESHRAVPGLQYVRLFVTSTIVLIALSFCIGTWRNASLLAMFLWAVFLIAFFAFVLPIEGLYDRFLWPAYATFCVTGAIGLRDLVLRLNLRRFGWFAIVSLAANVSIVMLSPRTQQSFAAHEEVWDANMNHVIQELTALPHFDSLRLAYGDAGYVVYESGINHIDLFGLNDTRIAHSHTVSERAAIVSSEQPDLMLLPIRMRGDSSTEFIEDAYGVARSASFESCATIEAFPYTLVLLLNKNSKWYLDCKNSIARRLLDNTSYLRTVPEILH